MIRVLMADDHPLVRAGLKYLLAGCSDIQLMAEVDNGNELVKRLSHTQVDVILVDLLMPGRSGVELIKQIKAEYPRLPVVVLSSYKEDMFALRTIKAGASGYICKDHAAERLIDAIRKVAAGGVFISDEVLRLIANDLHTPVQSMAPHTLLSDREYQIFLLIVAGFSPCEIADRLNISVKTISTHKTRIKEKTKLANTSDFVRYALNHKLSLESIASL
ncbi:response regulator transcription factor [Rheinheimera sp. EpRS3]|uniref:response regulator transcription factor n=1 Tax=Rheinheimera sp. EpRS3 TaxID=1712383 RepID=UPI00074704A9|nr:response regulator transcription factor [Rheinheimera sp. EpRS3]KUM55198.1 LuxR family transcriptional regulator [Rheinheimera sp. EpRS3]